MANEVVIYTTDWCPYCSAAKRFLDSKKVRYREVDVTGDDAAREKLVAMSGGRATVPQIFADGKPIGGYDDLVRLYASGGKL
jgi:glutaredoxin 3